MPRYFPLAAWFLSWLSTVLVIVLNAAGTTTVNNGDHPDQVQVMLSGTPILSITTPNFDVQPSGWTTLIHTMYLNGACLAPPQPIDEEFGPICIAASPGATFNLTRLLVTADPYLGGWYPNRTVPIFTSAATQHIHLAPIHKIVPFIFYVISAINTTILIIIVPRGFGGRRREAAVHFSIAGGSFVALMIASAILTSEANWAMGVLKQPGNAEYISALTSSRGYQGLTWGCTASSFLSSILLFAEWRMQRFTPFGQKISRHWKPAAVSWLGRRPAELREQQRRMVPVAVDENGGGSGSGDEGVERRRGREFVSFDARLRAMAMERRARGGGMVGGNEGWRMERWG